MIHASQLFPIALDRIHDHLERGHANRTKAQALLDAFEEGEKRGKRGGRKASDRETIRVKRNAERARQMEFNL